MKAGILEEPMDCIDIRHGQPLAIMSNHENECADITACRARVHALNGTVDHGPILVHGCAPEIYCTRTCTSASGARSGSHLASADGWLVAMAGLHWESSGRLTVQY